jgi:tetratricopeptide (TPR) repeat protein
MNRWGRTAEGEGQVVLVVGEAGVGKSRLVRQFREQIVEAPHTWLESGAVPFFQNTPFSAVINLLQQGFHWGCGWGVEKKLAALEASLATAGIMSNEGVPMLARLLELSVDGEYPPSSLSPEQQRKRLLTTLVEWVIGAAKAQPLVIAIEDLHWADPSTLELIRLLVEQGATIPLLLLFTARPEFNAPWPLRVHYIQITLDRLSQHNVRQMIAHVTAGKALAAETVNSVIERTSGVPLFVEELTRAVLESGDTKFGACEIPVTLHDSLMARMDRLGQAKEVLQIAAVLGSKFSYKLLQAIRPNGNGDLEQTLDALVNGELLYVRGIPPDATYQFKHALIRDAAYESLLKSRRKDLHRLIAQTISENFPALKAAQPEVLARHWTEASETERAIAEWSRAGKAAGVRGAFTEAEKSFQQALKLLNLLPESRERDSRELKLRLSLVSMLSLRLGNGATETVEAAGRVAQLAAETGDLLGLVGSITTRVLHAFVTGDLAAAAALTDEGLELVLSAGNPNWIAILRLLQMIVPYYRGDFTRAENYFGAGLIFFHDPVIKQDPSGIVPQFFGWASLNAWVLGRAEIARERLDKMRAVTNPDNPHDLAYSDFFAANLYTLMRENEGAETLAARALDLSEKHGLGHPAACARCFLGQAQAQLGRAAASIALLGSGIDALLQIGNRLSVPRFLTCLAIAQNLEGATGDALETAERALNFNLADAYYRPETLRIRGELRLRQGNPQLAEADFRDSIAMARSMGAKAWELRTTMSIARLLDSDGRRAEARTMLDEVYSWFIEGFDTPDLKDAKALLDELAK